MIDIYKDLKPPQAVAFIDELHQPAGIERIAEIFARYFQNWQITLPADHGTTRQRGAIQQAGWMIQYMFGHDEHGDYLDYYAQHRMTNAVHERIYANGDVQYLPAEHEFMVFHNNATPEQKQQIEQEYYAYNRAIGEMLRDKGFR